MYPAVNTNIQFLIYFFVLYHLLLSGKMLRTFRLKNSAWDFFDVDFLSRDFLGGLVLEALGIFLALDFCHHLIIPIT